MKMKIAFIGFGVVGRGLAEILVRERDWLLESQGVDFVPVAICDLLRGSLYRANGIDLAACLSAAEAGDSFESIEADERGWDALATIRNAGADTIVEVTPTDIKTGEPGLTHIREALGCGRHAVTTNKGPVVLAVRELHELATCQGVQFRYEGTVMSGTPVLNVARRFLAGNRITRIRGVLNGTTNYILTKMEAGMGYEDALKKAQELGYAETKPDADVLGWDTLGKVLILANVVMGCEVDAGDVPCEGITGITSDEIASAAADGERWRLIGEVASDIGRVSASVGPVRLPASDPLASLQGPSNAITFSTELLGDVTIQGPGAGKPETGFALLSDLLEIARSA